MWTVCFYCQHISILWENMSQGGLLIGLWGLYGGWALDGGGVGNWSSSVSPSLSMQETQNEDY